MRALTKPDLLSIWEVATRLHEIDTEVSTIDSLPPEAKDTLRSLIIDQGSNLNIFDVDDNELLPTLIPIVNVVREHPVAKKLMRMAKDRQYDKIFLDSVYIDKAEYEYLMLMRNLPLPTFWFNDDDIECHNEERLKAFGKLPEQKAATTLEIPKSERHSKAAQIKHAPKNQVIEQLVVFYQTGIFKSKAQAVRKFIASLPSEKRQLFSAERIERTLADALAKRLNQNSPTKGNK